MAGKTSNESVTLVWDTASFLAIVVAALERRIQQLQAQKYIIVADTSPGVYGHDAQGNPWATFECINHTVSCAVCGASIDGGWVRGRFGEDQLHVCSKHVMYVYERQESR